MQRSANLTDFQKLFPPLLPPTAQPLQPPNFTSLLQSLTQQPTFQNVPNPALDIVRFQQHLHLQQQLLLQHIVANNLTATKPITAPPILNSAFTPPVIHDIKPQVTNHFKNLFQMLNPAMPQLDVQPLEKQPFPHKIPECVRNLQAKLLAMESPNPSLETSPPVASTSTQSEPKLSPRSRSDSHDSFEMGRIPTSNYYPTHFMKGTIIELADGRTKKVEDMNSDDFLRCAEISGYLTMEMSVVEKMQPSGTLVKIHFLVGEDRVPSSQEYQAEHPFFVVAHGWSSYSPKKTKTSYGLTARQLHVGDICLSLTQRADDASGSALDSTVTLATAKQFAEDDAERRAQKRRHSLSDNGSTSDSNSQADNVSGGSSSSSSSPLFMVPPKSSEDSAEPSAKCPREEEIDISS